LIRNKFLQAAQVGVGNQSTQQAAFFAFCDLAFASPFPGAATVGHAHDTWCLATPVGGVGRRGDVAGDRLFHGNPEDLSNTLSLK
jgi:hypothetical protein